MAWNDSFFSDGINITRRRHYPRPPLIRIPKFLSNCPSISITALPPPLNGGRSPVLCVDSGPFLSSSLCCSWVALPVMIRRWTRSPGVQRNSGFGQGSWSHPRAHSWKPSSGPLYTLERLHTISLAFLTSSVLYCAHPSRAQGESSTPFAGGSHHLGQSGTLLTARSKLAAYLPGTTIPAHGSWITFPQDPEPTWIPVRTTGLGGNTFHHRSEHVSHCV